MTQRRPPASSSSGGRRTPDANIGLPTGARTGILVVDVDVHAGGSGFAAFERARSERLADAWGWLIRTPSGGIHAYYPAARGQEQRSWQVPSAHIDFRGDGGYVIAPPSRLLVDGVQKTYDVIAVTTRRPGSVDSIKLRQFLEPPRPRASAPTSGLHANGCHPEALARTVALSPGGGRNRALFWASCRMAENGQSCANAIDCLMPAAQYAGLPDREIESTIDSAFRAASRPRSGGSPGPTQRNEAIRYEHLHGLPAPQLLVRTSSPCPPQGNEAESRELARHGDPSLVVAAGPSKPASIGITWIRPTELAGIAAPVIGRGIDLQAELVRRARRTPITTTRALTTRLTHSPSPTTQASRTEGLSL